MIEHCPYCGTVQDTSSFYEKRERKEDRKFQAELREMAAIQAEVDKYAAALLAGGPELLAGYGVGLFLARSRDLRRRLFVEQELLDAPGSAEHDRYLHATSVAAEYTGGLERTFVRRGDREGLVRELRRYYRAGRTAKLGRR